MPSHKHPRGPSRAQWNEKRSVIHDLYIVQRRELADVQSILARQHNFNASIQMFKARFTRWNWTKSKNGKIMVAADRRRNQPDRIGKRNVFTYKGRRFTDADVDNYHKRRKDYSNKTGAGPPSPTMAITENLTCSTPESGPSDVTMLSAIDSSPMTSCNDAEGGFDIWSDSQSGMFVPASTHSFESQVQPYLRAGRKSPSIPVPGILISRDLETDTQSVLILLDNMFTSYFGSGQWYSRGPQTYCCSVSANCADPSRIRSESNDMAAELSHCLVNALDNNLTNAVAHLSRACRSVKDVLTLNQPHLIRGLLTVMRPLFNGSNSTAWEFVRIFVTYFGKYAFEVHRSMNHPLVQLAKFLVKYCEHIWIYDIFLTLNEDCLRRELPEKGQHYEVMRTRVGRLLFSAGESSFKSTSTQLLQDAHVLFGQDQMMFLQTCNAVAFNYLKQRQFQDVEELYHFPVRPAFLRECGSHVESSYLLCASRLFLAEAQLNLGHRRSATESLRMGLQTLQNVRARRLYGASSDTLKLFAQRYHSLFCMYHAVNNYTYQVEEEVEDEERLRRDLESLLAEVEEENRELIRREVDRLDQE